MTTHGLLDFFIQSLDDDSTGIGGVIRRADQALQRICPSVHENLTVKGVSPEYYSFRWISLLFAKEFHLLDLFRLWDFFLSSKDQRERNDMIIGAVVALLESHRGVLEKEDLPEILTLLHVSPDKDIDVEVLIGRAREIVSEISL
jgi:hypothetical protein